MKKFKYDLGIVIGRFQPFHKGHKHLIDSALKKCRRVLVLIGSANKAISAKNPFTYEERKRMISHSYLPTVCLNSLPNLESEERPQFIGGAHFPSAMGFWHRVSIEPLNDYLYDETRWTAQVLDYAYHGYTPPRNLIKIAIFGFERDDSSYYLKSFPEFDFVAVPELKEEFRKTKAGNIFPVKLEGTAIRSYLRGNFGADIGGKSHCIKRVLPKGCAEYVRDIFLKEKGRHGEFEREWCRLWFDKAFYGSGPFETADFIVTQGDKILLITRKNPPGKGLLALPGGFLNEGESPMHGAFRELEEETGIPRKLLISPGVRSFGVLGDFAHKDRSQRGDVRTHVFFAELSEEINVNLTQTEDNRYLYFRLKAADDAAGLGWYDMNTLKPTEMHEDHHEIINIWRERYGK